MSYLLDRKIKKRNFFKITLGVVVLFFIIYFHTAVFRGLSSLTHSIFRPVLVLGNNIKERFSNSSSFFRSKKSLMQENQNLKSQLSDKEATVSNYNSVLDDNTKLKEILGRKNETSEIILGAILSKPNRSPYDTLIVDIGTDKNIAVGDKVFAFGNVPIGRVAEVYVKTSKVILFSSPGEKTEVVASFHSVQNTVPPLAPSASKDIFLQAVGRGGGNFEMVLPRELILEKGTEINLPGIVPYVLGTVAEIISDPRDAFIKALLVSPVNIQELKFVEVQK